MEESTDAHAAPPESPLISAVRAGDLAAVTALCEAGGDVSARDDNDWSALDWAAGRGDTAIVAALIERGADVLAVGREGRRAYQIALAAGHVAAADALAAAEDSADPALADERVWRPYCRGYLLSDLAKFEGWPADAVRGGEEADGEAEEPVFFVHDDYTVTRSIWRGEDNVFDEVSEAWRRFCVEQLGFRVPRDRDLVHTPGT
jgi:hypothetical protein